MSATVEAGDAPHRHCAESSEHVTHGSAIGPLGIRYVDPENGPTKRSSLHAAWTARVQAAGSQRQLGRD